MASHTHTQPELSNLIWYQSQLKSKPLKLSPSGSAPYEEEDLSLASSHEVYGQGLAILVPRRLVQEKNTSGSKEDGVKSLAPSGDEERRGL
ncbi:hypothetical protein IGI04_042755 [Brassica rapa subsp. trilocularis]|uniref:Uncharacterized protein n=1 Tax=Brassica rapa subsp. trilocularis TaxID=1813537 RepID=A0ABQ7KL21_BRACM|nr:hypothetical protein IGI04_042755 [Brassica rapa subsp. trilocularis]